LGCGRQGRTHREAITHGTIDQQGATHATLFARQYEAVERPVRQIKVKLYERTFGPRALAGSGRFSPCTTLAVAIPGIRIAVASSGNIRAAQNAGAAGTGYARML
jgi:hypothetical protein